MVGSVIVKPIRVYIYPSTLCETNTRICLASIRKTTAFVCAHTRTCIGYVLAMNHLFPNKHPLLYIGKIDTLVNAREIETRIIMFLRVAHACPFGMHAPQKRTRNPHTRTRLARVKKHLKFELIAGSGSLSRPTVRRMRVSVPASACANRCTCARPTRVVNVAYDRGYYTTHIP